MSTVQYPNAKVIHTERKSVDLWFDSAWNTLSSKGNSFPSIIIVRVIPFFRTHVHLKMPFGVLL